MIISNDTGIVQIFKNDNLLEQGSIPLIVIIFFLFVSLQGSFCSFYEYIFLLVMSILW